MLSKLKSIAIIFIIIIEVGCATTVPKPFKIDKEEFFNKTKTIVMVPITIPDFIDNQNLIRAKFETMIEDKLRNAGFLIISSKEMDYIWNQHSEKIGGVFNPLTGKRDESKQSIVFENTMKELNIKYHPDALLYSGIIVVAAKFSGVMASWHGVTEYRSASSALGGLLKEFGTMSTGSMRALSLGIGIKNNNGTEIYNHWGGIQLLQKVTAGNFIVVPKNELLVRNDLNEKAVLIALEPIINPNWSEGN